MSVCLILQSCENPPLELLLVVDLFIKTQYRLVPNERACGGKIWERNQFQPAGPYLRVGVIYAEIRLVMSTILKLHSVYIQDSGT